MRLAFSLTNVTGVVGAILDGTEAVYASIIVPEKNIADFKKKIKENKTYAIMEENIKKGAINPSTAFIDKSVKIPNLKATNFLLVSSLASAKSASLEKQYFLIKKDIENQEAELKKRFFTQNMKKLPIPVHEDWQDFFWEGIAPMFRELDSIGNVPYKGYVLELSNIEKLQDLVEISHVKAEFKARFKRVPRLEALFAIGDIANFDFKDWQNFLKNMGGPEKFQDYSIDIQKGLVRAFELLDSKETDLIVSNKNLWYASSIKNANILQRVSNDKEEKKRIKAAFSVLIKEFINKRDYIFSIISNFERLFKEHAQNIRNKNWDAIMKYLDQIQYPVVAPGAEELAKVCGAAKVSEHEYLMFEEQYLKNLSMILKAPRSYPTIKVEYAKNAEWELMDMSDPRAWVVGIETYCCMHPASVGGVCLEYASENPIDSGILRITDKGKTVAQSFMWISKPNGNGDRIMVLDNIEVAGNEIRDLVKEAYRDFAMQMQAYASLFKIKAITVGTGYSDINLRDICERKLDKDDALFAPLPDSLRYSDANSQWLLAKLY